jgi:hypothetical protein
MSSMGCDAALQCCEDYCKADIRIRNPDIR